jgi:hypothetical protein
MKWLFLYFAASVSLFGLTTHPRVYLQFLIFDGSNKGYVIEDDCMEILYARYGG